MGLDLLDTPIRLTWDFPDPGQLDRDKSISIAECIQEAGVFVVALQGSPLRHEFLPDILTSLAGSHCTLSCHAAADELKMLAGLQGFSGQVILDVTAQFLSTGYDREELSDKVGTLRNINFDPVLALTPLRDNLALIPDLIDFCKLHHISKFKLPNANIGDSFHEYSTEALPNWQDLKKFSNLWNEYAASRETLPSLEIHDLFLWEIMTPGHQQTRSEYGGCQAGNSLAHVDKEGVVHPCAAWPQPLGVLPEHSLDEIWQGTSRKAVCQKISETPDGCIGCHDLDICFGGCRGLATHLNQAEGERDLMCPGLRK